MVILNPVNYNIKDITVYSSTRENITEEYLNILIKTAATPSFRINGKPPSSAFVPFSAMPGYAYLQLNLNKDSTNTYHLQADDGFNAVAYGFGNVESYSYSAGTNLSKTVLLTGIETATNAVIDSACLNADYYFKLTIPYSASRISWQMDASETGIVQTSPAGKAVMINGETAYEYSFPKTAAYQHPGLHQLRVVADYNSNGCSAGQQEVNYSFFVIDPPTASFEKKHEPCSNTVDFTDKSSNPGHSISSWHWDFGDGSSNAAPAVSSLQNPVHHYLDSGTYVVRLTVTSSTGCQNSLTDTVRILSKVTPAFTANNACAGKLTIFSDISRTSYFNTSQRKWIFGDGDTTIASGPLVSHRYVRAGSYQVKMLLTDRYGCPADTLVKTVTIHASPVADFDAPPLCLTDQFAHFTNQSVPGQAGDNLQFFWNFGDDLAGPGNPDTSSAASPVHRYSAARSYQVSLKAVTPDGCDSIITKTITVNGVVPRADFEILNQGAICQGDLLLLKNLSHVEDFGNITRLEWHFQAPGVPLQKLEIDTVKPNSIYPYPYPKFPNVTGSLNCTITLVAYSGTLCADSIQKNIVLLPFPRLQLDSIAAVCLDAPAFLLTGGKELNGLTGLSKYSGSGVTTDGHFDPQLAGIGHHQVTYSFTSAAGCTDSISGFISVLAQPQVNSGNVTLFQGKTTRLSPSYSGPIISYKWTPALGLSSDTVATPLASPLQSTLYTVTVSNGVCEAAGSFQVTVLKPITISNTFTPNGDGINDVWKIDNLGDYPEATVEVFNRYGARLFYSRGYYKPWDGRFSGADLPVGAYYYIIRPSSGVPALSGFVMILR
jgi:gliding motility-associated-like protein